MRANGISLFTTWDGKLQLTLTVDKGSVESTVHACEELADAGDLEFTVKKFRKKRSLDANAYLWQLIGKLAEKLGLTSVEVYMRYVRHCGIYKDFMFTEEEATTFVHVWTNMGIGWQIEKLDFAADGDRTIYRAYYGSSVYNTKQMSRLINAVVDDCKEQGIETMTPAQLSGLYESRERTRRTADESV